MKTIDAIDSNIKTERIDLPITGMTCAACANRIQKQLNKSVGVNEAGVNFATSKATIEFNPNQTNVKNLIETVIETGYGVADTKAEISIEDSIESARDNEYIELKRKFWIAAILSLPVLIIAMSHGRIEVLNFSGANWLQLILTTPAVIANYCERGDEPFERFSRSK